MPSVSVRLRKTSNVSGRVAHDFRTRMPGYADPKREHLNAVLHGQPYEEIRMMEEVNRALSAPSDEHRGPESGF